MDDYLPEEWALLRKWLPEQMGELAKEEGFMRRARGVQDAQVWLRLILMHAGGGLSLEQTVMRAGELGLAKVSAVALHKRLVKAGPWLEKLTQLLVNEPGRRHSPPEDWRRNVVVVDATSVHEPGSTGTDWRVHYRVRLSDLKCEHYELTGGSEAEGLSRHKFESGQIVLADRGYCHRAGAAHVLESEADLVLRLQTRAFPLEHKDQTPIDLNVWAKSLRHHHPKECSVYFRHGAIRYPLRLCAIRKSRSATLRAQKKQREKASRSGQNLTQNSIELAEYIFVLTSLNKKDWPTERVLNLYRHRWQVELVFKRLKSLLGLGHVPKTNDRAAEAWMQAKILTALLIERAMQEARFFSPWGFALQSQPLGSIPRSA